MCVVRETRGKGGSHLNIYQKASEVSPLLKLRHLLKHPSENRVDHPRVAMQQRLLRHLIVHILIEMIGG